MSRALLALSLVFLASGCSSETPPLPPARAAPPQTAELDWRERAGEAGAQIVFGVERFEVLENGWKAEISLTNRTGVRFSVDDREDSLDNFFGVMLFRTGDLRELEQLNEARKLPAIRHADSFRPALPLVLEPGQTWRGAMSARGSLAGRRWVRIVFGALVPIGEPPGDLPDPLVWVTDHAYRLRAA